MPSPASRPQRQAAGLLLARRSGDGWRHLLLHASSHGEWGFPKGHAEPGEGLRSAALRECAEECGIAVLRLLPGVRRIGYEVAGRLKEVTYYPAVTRQERVVLSPEHDDYRWCTRAEVEELLAHENLRTLYRHHLREDGLE